MSQHNANSMPSSRPPLNGTRDALHRQSPPERELAQGIADHSELFDRVLSSITDFIYTFDLDGRFTFVNQPLLNLWGLSMEKAKGKNFFDLQYPAELAGKLQQQIQQVIDTRQRLVDETPYVSPTGSAGYYQYIFSPVIGVDGAVEAVAGSTRDITERKLLEEETCRLNRALEAERSQLVAVIDQAPAFICTLRGPDHIFELANERYFEMVGRRDIIGKAARQAFPEIEGQGFFELLDSVYRSGETFTGNRMPITFRRSSDNAPDRRYINFIYQALRDSDGRISGIFVHGIDVTDSVESQEALQQREARLRTSEERLAFALDAAELGTFYCPMPLGEIVWNDTCKKHFWLPADAQINFDLFYSIIHPDDRQRVRSAVEQTVYGQQAYDVQYRTVGPQGQIRWVRAKGRAYHDDAGNPTRFDGVTLDITEQKRADQSLRETEEFYRFAAEAGRTGSWSVNLESLECTLSPMMTELMGFPKGQTTASPAQWRESVVPADRDRLAAAMQASIELQEPFDVEFRIALPDGKHRWLYSHGGVVRDASDKALLLRGASVDLTERKEAEAALRQNREQMGIVVRGANVGVWYCPLPFDELIWDATVKEHFHLPPDAKVTIDTFYQRLHPDDRLRTRQTIEASIQQRQPYDIDYRTVSPDGTGIKWIRASGRGFYDAAGNPTRFDGITIDVTQQKRAEERERQAAAEATAAAEVNAKFRTFFDQGTYFAGLMNLEGNMLEANRLCLEACGFSRDDVIGKKFWECGWWNRSPTLMNLVREGSMQAAAGLVFRTETAYFTADGSKRMVDLTVAPVTDETGRVLFVAPTGSDITEKKHLEEERERLLKAERNARAEAESANHAKDKFLAVLSHELRTPLSPVFMTIPAMEADPELPAKFRKDLAMVRRNIELEVKLIDDLLDLSSVTSGKLRLQMQPVQVHDLLRHIMQSSFSEVSCKNLRLSHQFEAEADRATADPARLQQVFWNLLRNAVKFTPDGGQINIRTHNTNDRKQIIVEIQDNGAGIAPEILPRIFDAFEQGEARVTRQFGGLGLGLAIAKAVIEMHCGVITAASAGRGQGATFTVQLQTSLGVLAEATAVPASAPAVNINGGAARVLLVEDHPDTARTIARLLTMAGFKVKTAHSVASALGLAAAESFDVVVSDLGLPDATGYELMEQLRSRYGICGIALSGYGMEEDLRKSRDAGFVEHLVKPVNIEQLEATLRRVIKGN